MTNPVQPRSVEPRTEAGRALLDDILDEDGFIGNNVGEHIAAIEAEAAAQALSERPDERLREALERLIDLHREAIDKANAFMPRNDLIEYRENIVRPFIRALSGEPNEQ